MRTIILSILLLLALSVKSQNTWQDAEKAYENQDFQTALSIYQSLETELKNSPDYWYNRANAAYKTKLFAEAVWAYHSCLKLDPNYEAAQQNLAIVEKNLVDKITDSPSSAFNSKLSGLISSLPKLPLQLIGFLTLITLVLSFVLKRAGKISSMAHSWLVPVSAIVFLLSTGLSFAQENNADNASLAVIEEERINILSAPNEKGATLFVLHEGTTVSILNQNENWCEIQLSDGRIGWIPTDELLIV